MHGRILIIISTFLLTVASCKTKKEAIKHAPQEKKPASKEYTELSRRLNFEVNKGDNIKLYSYIADWLGIRHKTGGCDKSGIDCSCFIRMVTEHVYQKKLARTAADMQQQVKRIEKGSLGEGDLVFFNIKSSKPSHVGIYLKNGWFAHVSTSKGVMINNLSEAYYDTYFSGAGSTSVLSP